MPNNAEYKEFFVRQNTVVTGGSPDQENLFPTKELVTKPDGTSSLEFNRYLKGHFPSERVYKKLMNSITFKLNHEDTASRSVQGLVRIAIGKNIVDRADIDTNYINGFQRDFTTVVVPSTLPIVSAGANVTVTPRIRKVSDNSIVVSITPGDRELYYMDYEVATSIPTPDPPIDNIKNYFNVNFVRASSLGVDPNDTDLLVLGTHIINASSLAVDMDLLKYKLGWFSDGSVNGNCYLQIYVGNDLDINNCIKAMEYIIDATEINVASFLALFDIEIVRDTANGYMFTSKSQFYDGTGNMQESIAIAPKTFELNQGVIFRDINNNPYKDTIGANWKYVLNAPNCDWGARMYIHFRLKMNGSTSGDFAHVRYNIHGKSFVD